MKSSNHRKHRKETEQDNAFQLSGVVTTSIMVGVVLILFSVFFYTNLTSEKEGRDVVQADTVRVETIPKAIPKSCSEFCLETREICEKSCRDNDYFTEAKKTEDKLLCDNILKDGLRLNCQEVLLQRQARSKQDASLCDGITDDVLIIECKDIVWQDKAFSDDNESLCDRIMDKVVKSDCHDTFLQNKAMVQSNLSLCELIKSPGTKSRCEGTVWYDKAVGENDVSICEQITNEIYYGSCRDVFLHKDALRERNTSLCSLMSTDMARARCEYAILGPILVESEKEAESAIDTRTSLDRCFQACFDGAKICNKSCDDYYNLNEAILKDDSRHCEKITDNESRTDCYNTIILNRAVEKKDLDTCGQITNSDMRIQCSRRVIQALAQAEK